MAWYIYILLPIRNTFVSIIRLGCGYEKVYGEICLFKEEIFVQAYELCTVTFRTSYLLYKSRGTIMRYELWNHSIFQIYEKLIPVYELFI